MKLKITRTVLHLKTIYCNLSNAFMKFHIEWWINLKHIHKWRIGRTNLEIEHESHVTRNLSHQRKTRESILRKLSFCATSTNIDHMKCSGRSFFVQWSWTKAAASGSSSLIVVTPVTWGSADRFTQKQAKCVLHPKIRRLCHSSQHL